MELEHSMRRGDDSLSCLIGCELLGRRIIKSAPSPPLCPQLARTILTSDRVDCCLPLIQFSMKFVHRLKQKPDFRDRAMGSRSTLTRVCRDNVISHGVRKSGEA